MKVIWMINIPLPEASLLMNESPLPIGGWLINASQDLAAKAGCDLHIIFPQKGIKETLKLEGSLIKYYAISLVNTKKMIDNNSQLDEIVADINPDIIHIYGTEMNHSLAMINVANKRNINTVISIQGLVSIYEKHMYANLPNRVIFGNTIRNILNRDSVRQLRKKFIYRGKNEIKALKGTENIIGRTSWDRACTSQINPMARYHFCNETLRESFYQYEWKYNQIEEFSIFLSQADYPIKGLHYVIEAMCYVVKQFPQTKLYISGKNITKADTLKDKLLMTAYGKYISKLIKNYKLENNITFLGYLDEKEMCERYLKSNLFICPSSIENSPNSLGEAMILGVPCIASNVGGVMDMMQHKEEGFIYQGDAPYMLAYYICEVFKDKDMQVRISEKAKKHARDTHNKTKNTNRLIEIYTEIIEDKYQNCKEEVVK
ncbi:glycosyltransferase family 4 protein [Niameybacter massiliensis]|uniref:glycosyltransferase family 4 protein n=1 Tax=Niameybacter massiliensis TaxID=1658108 RepID=UPI0006B59A43|nr:glycosyltransferase family 4 protein [Niameybacter massiliensis]